MANDPADDAVVATNGDYTIGAPVTGANAPITVTNGQIIVDITWAPALVAGKFAAGTVYTATYSNPVAESGFTLVGANITPTINGLPLTADALTFVATSAASTDASLSALALGSGTLSPTFASGTYVYTASVGNGTSTITVTPTKTDAGASFVQYLGAEGTTAFTGAIAVGANIIRTIVTAADGTTLLTYTVTVTRAAGTPPPSEPTVDYAAIAAAQAAAKAAADKAAADKLLAEKAAADAKVAAEKLAAEKVAADAKAVVEAAAKAAEEKLAQEKVIATEQAAVAAVRAAAEKAAANTVKIVPTAKATRISIDLADRYYGRVAYVQLVTKTKTGVRTTTLDYFVIDSEDGKTNISVGKLLKGQRLQVRIGKTIVFNKTI